MIKISWIKFALRISLEASSKVSQAWSDNMEIVSTNEGKRYLCDGEGSLGRSHQELLQDRRRR